MQCNVMCIHDYGVAFAFVWLTSTLFGAMQSLSGTMSQFGNAPTVDKREDFVTARVADRGSVQGGGRMHNQIVPSGVVLYFLREE